MTVIRFLVKFVGNNSLIILVFHCNGQESALIKLSSERFVITVSHGRQGLIVTLLRLLKFEFGVFMKLIINCSCQWGTSVHS